MVTKNSWARTWPGVCRLTYPTLLIFRLLPILIYIGRYPVVSVFLLTTQKILFIFSRHYHNNPNYLIVICLLKASRFRFARTDTHYLLHSVSKKGLSRRLVDQFVCLKLQPSAWDIRAASRSCPLDAVVVADVMETDVTYLGTAVGFTRTVLGWAEKVTSRGGWRCSLPWGSIVSASVAFIWFLLIVNSVGRFFKVVELPHRKFAA